MTGEAQCEERKRTLAWHHVHPEFALQAVMKSRLVDLSQPMHDSQYIRSLSNASDFTASIFHWHGCTEGKKKHLLLLNSRFAEIWQEQYTYAWKQCVRWCVKCAVRDWAWISRSQEKPKWSIITSTKLPLFPFQHHTELRYQLTHYPLSPGDW